MRLTHYRYLYMKSHLNFGNFQRGKFLSPGYAFEGVPSYIIHSYYLFAKIYYYIFYFIYLTVCVCVCVCFFSYKQIFCACIESFILFVSFDLRNIICFIKLMKMVMISFKSKSVFDVIHSWNESYGTYVLTYCSIDEIIAVWL